MGLGVLRRAGLVVTPGPVETEGTVSEELLAEGVGSKAKGNAAKGQWVGFRRVIACGDAYARTTPRDCMLADSTSSSIYKCKDQWDIPMGINSGGIFLRVRRRCEMVCAVYG